MAEFSISFDPHVHSEGSFDGKEPVELILQHADDIGLDAIAITDHDVIEYSLEAVELAQDYDVIAVPGVEVSTKAGHLLGLGIEEKPPKKLPVAETIEMIKAKGGTAIIPHPFQRMRHGIPRRKITACDGIEVYNAWLFTGYRNRQAARYAKHHEFTGIAASDAHRMGTVGRAYTELEIEAESRDDITAEDILQAISNGDTGIQGRRKPIHTSAIDYTKALLRKGRWLTDKIPHPGR
ncbi:MAG: PHP domain-containing protein [Candidatus Nanohaloarchaeota archaeon QJJ-5]|nr:PHP domain-containing protein [Candidatus Nanohaloarchaeota archaeon QJJ-5]